jgi:signal transduction histidine kinase
MDLPKFLQSIEELEAVPLEQLAWMAEKAEIQSLEIGEMLFAKGSQSDNLIIMIEGKVSIYVDNNGNRKHMADLLAGDITGVLPYSRMKAASGYGEALERSKILFLHRDHFPEMIQTQYELTEAFVHKMLNRTRDFTTFRIQNEKLMALGKLSAGLAHELNNPISAIVRNASNLKKHLGHTPDSFKKITKIKVDDEHVDNVNRLLYDRINKGLQLDIPLLEKTELEDDCIDWLEDHGIEDADEAAELLTEFGIGTEDLDCILGEVGEEYIVAVLSWCFNILGTEKFVLEIQDASKRVSELVSSIKEYSYMDRSHDKQAVNIHHGLRNSITMLSHKFRKNKVEFVDRFCENMPKVNALPGELNQVWTNILDNALDAMEDSGGKLEIKTEFDKNFAKIYIIDSGPGIPEDIQSRIFDPFFTTKEMGKGTGLGLEVVQKIIKQHRGEIRINSVPRRTEFLICLPL